MKKILLRAILLLMPFVLWVGGFELKYRPLNNNRYVLKKRLLESRLADIDVLAMGSSHGQQSLQPEILSKNGFNLANPGQSLYYDAQLVLKYVDRMPSLKVVVLPISYFSLESMLDQNTEKWRCYYYKYFFSIPHRDRAVAHDCRNYFLYFLYGRSGSLFAKEQDFDKDVSKWFNEQGGLNLALGDKHEALQHTKLSLAAAAAERLGRANAGLQEKNLPENVRFLRELIAVLQRRNIPIVIITTPVTSYYRKMMWPEVYERMQQAISSLCREKGVSYYNYLADDRFTESDFMDSDHLGAEGIVKFSRMFRDEVLNNLLVRRSPVQDGRPHPEKPAD